MFIHADCVVVEDDFGDYVCRHDDGGNGDDGEEDV
jgi:hypothetical protein